eukprot:jgi/Mesen1/2596/ME000166S01724
MFEIRDQAMAFPKLADCVAFAFYIALSAVPTEAFYSVHSNVVTLEPKSYKEVIQGSEDPWLVEYFGTSCQFCKGFAPDYEAIANTLRDIVKVGAIDCTAHGELCYDAGIRRLPGLKGFKQGRTKKKQVEYDGSWKPRNVIEFATELLPAGKVENVTTAQKAASFLSKTKKSATPKVVVYAHKTDLTPLSRWLAASFKKQLKFAHVPVAAADIVSAHSVMELPAVVVHQKGKEQVRYDGEFKPHAIAAFLKAIVADTTAADSETEAEVEAGAQGKGRTSQEQEQAATSSKDDEAEEADEVKEEEAADPLARTTAGGVKPKAEEAEAKRESGQVPPLADSSVADEVLAPEELAEAKPEEPTTTTTTKGGQQQGEGEAAPAPALDVQLTDGDDFEQKLMSSQDVWLVAFFGAGGEECKRRVEEWHAAAAALSGMASLGELNVSAHSRAKQLADKYGVRQQAEDPERCLALLLFPFGPDKEDYMPQVYGGPVEAKELSAFVMAAFPDDFVTTVTDESMDKFVLLFSNKVEVTSTYRALSTVFRDFLLFAKIPDTSQVLLMEFKVSKFPAVRVMLPKPSEQWKTGDVQMMVHEYHGPLKYQSLALYLRQIVEGLPKLYGMAPVARVGNDSAFHDACIAHGGRLCVVGLFRGDAASDEDGEAPLEVGASGLAKEHPHAKLLQQVSNRWAGQAGAGGDGAGDSAGGPFSFMWVDVQTPAGASFAAQLGVEAADVPTVAVLSAPKMRHVVLRNEPFSGAAVMQLLEGLVAGKLRTAALQRLPTFEEGATGTSSSSNTDGPEELAVVEEEFSLDDVLDEAIEDASAVSARSSRLEEVEKELKEASARKQAEEAAKLGSKRSSKKKGKKAPKDEL